MIINSREYIISREATPAKVFLTNSVRTKSGLCPWTMSREPMDSVDTVQSAWAFTRVLVDNVYNCPHFQLSPWTLFRESMDIVQGDS